MSRLIEQDLSSALQEDELEGEDEARERTLATVRAAFAERTEPDRSRRRLGAILGGLAVVAAVLVGLTPAGADLRHWVDRAINPAATHPRAALTRLPGGGALLAESRAGASIVHADGSRRFLGDFSAVSWSPHGLYVGAASGRSLSALTPTGDPRWSQPAPGPVRFPAWSQRLGYSVAYLSHGKLRVIAGDGTGDRALGPAAGVAPAWRGRTDSVLAFASSDAEIRVLNVYSGRILRRLGAPSPLAGLAFSRDGGRLLAYSRHKLQITDERGPALVGYTAPRGSSLRAATFIGGSDRVALLETRASRGGSMSSRVSILGDHAGHEKDGSATPNVIFQTPGRLSGLAAAPDGASLIVGWRSADQWIFLEPHAGGKVSAVDDVSAQLDPGVRQPPFPAPSSWCCSR